MPIWCMHNLVEKVKTHVYIHAVCIECLQPCIYMYMYIPVDVYTCVYCVFLHPLYYDCGVVMVEGTGGYP